jgi:hypothetical protein
MKIYIWMHSLFGSSFCFLHRVAQEPVNLKYSLVLKGMFTSKPASQSVERYHSTVSSALIKEDLTLKNFCKFRMMY